MTKGRVARVIAALGNTDEQTEQDVVIPLMRHAFAREFGWTYKDTNALTLKQANQAMVLIGEDIQRRTE